MSNENTRLSNLSTNLTFFVLDLGFDVFDAVRGFDLKGDRLPRQRLHEDLHVETQAEDSKRIGKRLDKMKLE